MRPAAAMPKQDAQRTRPQQQPAAQNRQDHDARREPPGPFDRRDRDDRSSRARARTRPAVAGDELLDGQAGGRATTPRMRPRRRRRGRPGCGAGKASCRTQAIRTMGPKHAASAPPPAVLLMSGRPYFAKTVRIRLTEQDKKTIMADSYPIRPVSREEFQAFRYVDDHAFHVTGRLPERVALSLRPVRAGTIARGVRPGGRVFAAALAHARATSWAPRERSASR